VIPIDEYVLSTEKACCQLAPAEAESMRGEIINILKKAKPPVPNISKEEKLVLDKLRKETSIRIIPADKGRATVIMDKDDYETRVEEMLDDEKTYGKLNKDPTQRFKKKLVSIITRLENEDKLIDQQYMRPIMHPDSLPRLCRYINLLLTYLLTLQTFIPDFRSNSTYVLHPQNPQVGYATQAYCHLYTIDRLQHLQVPRGHPFVCGG